MAGSGVFIYPLIFRGFITASQVNCQELILYLSWEKMHDKPAKINPTTDLCIRLFILEKLNMSNQVFREAFREFDIGNIAKASRTASLKVMKPLTLPGTQISKRPFARA
jgi:hypothetical protein